MTRKLHWVNRHVPFALFVSTFHLAQNRSKCYNNICGLDSASFTWKPKNYCDRAVVMVKWSSGEPSTPTIRVRIPLNHPIFSVNLCLKRTKVNKKRSGIAHFCLKKLLWILQTRWWKAQKDLSPYLNKKA